MARCFYGTPPKKDDNYNPNKNISSKINDVKLNNYNTLSKIKMALWKIRTKQNKIINRISKNKMEE